MTTIDSKAVYLGSTNGEYFGFTVGKEYKIHDFGDGYIGAYNDKGSYCYIKNGQFHKFRMHDGNDGFVTESKCTVMVPEKPGFKYYINGYRVDLLEFDKAQSHVAELESLGVKCDTIKFEVKFE